MWFELKFTGSVRHQVEQYNRLIEQGYKAMIGSEGTVFVCDDGYRTGVMLSLKIDGCSITEYKDFSTLISTRKEARN